MRRCFLFCLLCFLLSGCASPEPALSPPETSSEPTVQVFLPQPQIPEDPIQALLNSMSIEEQVGQLFLARCDAEYAADHVARYHLGGLTLFGQDFIGQTPDSLRETLAAYQGAASIPLFIAVDEEGGTVTRISRVSTFRKHPFPSPRSAFDQGGLEGALANEEEKCRLLASLNINVNLGPVCDITQDPKGFMYHRSLGQNAGTTGDFAAQTVALMADHSIGSVLKHFPGYGNNADTHTGIARDSRSLEDLEDQDLIPFARGIQAGANAVMVNHTVVEALDADLPASLSPTVHSYLREVLNFHGVILTDDLAMQAITDRCGAGEAAVLAVLAGNDLLCSTDYTTQYEAVLAAVLDGRIDFFTLNAAVRRVLTWKQALGLL